MGRGWLGLATGAALGAAAWLLLRSGPEPENAPGPPPERALPEAAAPATAARPLERGAPEPLERTRETLAFQAQLREFFDTHRELDADERARRAAQLAAEVERREGAGLLLPVEALLIRLGLLRARIDDPAVLEHESRSLVEAYSAAAEAGRREAAALPDPRFEAYKREEGAVVREVMALEEIPDGTSRGALLRQRLQALRERIYAEDGAPAEGPP